MRTLFWFVAMFSTGLIGLFPGFTGFQKMVAIASLIFVITKAHVLSDYVRRVGKPGLWNRVLWLTTWPGLNADEFFETSDRPASTTPPDWASALLRTFVGGILIFVSQHSDSASPLIRGWMAMVGVILVLHFGSLHLVALAWRNLGRNVVPIMDSPIRSTSLAEFWGRRWNLAFRDYSHRFVFRPLTRRWNASVAMWCGFVFSGLIHELAISVPAGAGFGFPFAYFLLQGLGVSIERHLARRGHRIRSGVVGWCFTAGFTVPAAYLLFHPPFVSNVILPFIGS
ncbi:MAG: MBOAT family protein [Planctomycetota bacterium]|nr:MBOAT family protein [Planctomycetota bacterium]MDA1165920.1 MBOAT family protein [Planctomycetota bacterium]